MTIKIPNGRKIYQVCSHGIDQMAKNTPTFSSAGPSKINPNYDFWFENIPSGNPGKLD
jgi:hypothetical protein